jgi:HEAT repeat protein
LSGADIGTAGSARRRGEVALAGRAGDVPEVRKALEDPDPRVRVGALGALVRLGEAGPDDLAPLLADLDPRVRRDACELASRVPGSPVEPLLDDPDHGVVEAAAHAVGELGLHGATGRLSELASSHPDPLCRESAVAAIGALGDVGGLDAVLGALGDVPAVRRRAVVALAAFEGPEVEAALRRHLDDRDWQVRQAAAEVLGLSGVEPR